MIRLALVSCFVFAFASPGHAIVLGERDDFQAGTTEGWVIGIGSTNPSVVSDGGPGGDGDDFLRYDSRGGGGVSSRMIFFNEDQWSGDFGAAGVRRIELDAINLSDTQPLTLRVALGSTLSANSGTWWASTVGVELTAGSGWQSVAFDLDESSLTRVRGTESLADLLGAVDNVRILSSAAPANKGDRIAASVGVDNLRAASFTGDYDGDGLVTPADYAAWIDTFAAEGGLPADGNRSGVVDAADYTLWRDALVGDATSVPEPATTVLVGLACLGLGRRARHSARRIS